MKPETIEFLSLELLPIEESPLGEDIKKIENLPDKVWVVEYECDGRIWDPPKPGEEVTLLLFTPKFVQVVIDAYTGQTISCRAEDVED